MCPAAGRRSGYGCRGGSRSWLRWCRNELETPIGRSSADAGSRPVAGPRGGGRLARPDGRHRRPRAPGVAGAARAGPGLLRHLRAVDRLVRLRGRPGRDPGPGKRRGLAPVGLGHARRDRPRRERLRRVRCRTHRGNASSRGADRLGRQLVVRRRDRTDARVRAAPLSRLADFLHGAGGSSPRTGSSRSSPPRASPSGPGRCRTSTRSTTRSPCRRSRRSSMASGSPLLRCS